MVAGTLLAGGASAQSPSPSSSCTSVLVSLSPCLNYITGNETTAPASCCTQLGKVVQSYPQCLCVVSRRRLGLAGPQRSKTPSTSVDSGASPRGSAGVVAGFIVAAVLAVAAI
ncbi:hypothetical protein EJB05_15302, partial [Eragrostis curvula]